MILKELIKRGNVVTTEYKEDAETGRYLGNGSFGSVISGLGLNMSPQMQAKYPEKGQTQFMHMKHWGRFRFISDAMQRETTADYNLPLFKIHWENEPETISDYRQCQDFYDGTVETSFTMSGGQKIETLTWFDMVNKDLAGIRLDVSSGEVVVKISMVSEFIPYAFLHRKRTKQSVVVEEREDDFKVIISCKDTENDICSSIYFYTNTKVEIYEDGLRLIASKGKNEILVSYGTPIKQVDATLSLEGTKNKWHEIWEKSAWFDYPEETAQKTVIRSIAYLISSYDSKLEMIQPTNGLTGNMFPFHFVQDMEYMAPPIMMTGHADIVKHWIEKFAREIEDMKKYAKGLWPDAEGIYPPWELPYGEINGYHTPSVPVIYCYEPHNVGYLCRLAKEAVDFVNDKKWARENAYPLIREACEFYYAFATKKEDGIWHLKWDPCIGQDEAGGRNKEDYLCSLYSAKYCFQVAVELGLDKTGEYSKILKDGLAFEGLMSERGTYHTCHGADDFGIQKHPVQLDGLAYFPINKEPLRPEVLAYEMRHDITEGGQDSFYHGWTLGQFLLAGSNIQDVEGWKEDWAEMRASNYTDSQWVQIYETSGQAEKSFYVTNHGMILQSLIRNYVNDYWGCLDIAACPVFEGTVSFGNVRTRLGVTVSGTVNGNDIQLELIAYKDCKLRVNGISVEMKEGEKKNLYLS